MFRIIKGIEIKNLHSRQHNATTDRCVIYKDVSKGFEIHAQIILTKNSQNKHTWSLLHINMSEGEEFRISKPRVVHEERKFEKEDHIVLGR